MSNTEIIGTSGLDALRKHMDVLANNIANVNTDGFRKDVAIYEEHINPVAKASTFPNPDQKLSNVWLRRTEIDMTPGGLKATGAPLDVAVGADAFFVVETENGQRFTKAGSFEVNAEGVLVTPQGYPVQGEGGPIVFNSSDTNISIAADGTISTNNGTKGRLAAVRFENSEFLEKEGGNLFKGDNPEPTEARFVQGALETSNVKPVMALTEMINVQRNYQSLHKIISQMHELSKKAVEQLGTTNA